MSTHDTDRSAARGATDADRTDADPAPSAFGSTRWGGMAEPGLRADPAPAGAGTGSTWRSAAGSSAGSPAPFDVCHVGVVLRAVIAVEGALAIASGVVSPSWSGWLFTWSSASMAALPAVLLWLVGACATRPHSARLRPAWQAVAAMSWGAACGVLGLLLRAWAEDDSLPPVALWSAGLGGAAVAIGLTTWLRLRAAAEAPATSTARLAQLQASIRPHFLFNTLNSAVALVRLDPARAEGVLEDLAELFRTALAADQDPGASVSLDEEIALARRYLDIEQVRFGERLQMRWELDPAAGGARVPPLLLQPLVENAVRHGVEPSESGGLVRVRTRVARGQVYLSVANTVSGRPSRPGAGMALANVSERLYLLHDVAARFEAGRDADVYRVQIVLPLPS
jgi:two-component system, LytTR family, sensor histidine kinase AlgZ